MTDRKAQVELLRKYVEAADVVASADDVLTRVHDELDRIVNAMRAVEAWEGEDLLTLKALTSSVELLSQAEDLILQAIVGEPQIEPGVSAQPPETVEDWQASTPTLEEHVTSIIAWREDVAEPIGVVGGTVHYDDGSTQVVEETVSNTDDVEMIHPQHAGGSAKERICHYLVYVRDRGKNEYRSAQHIAEVLDIKVNTVSSALWQIHRAGHVLRRNVPRTTGGRKSYEYIARDGVTFNDLMSS